jgi:putative addiction module component (TIGR02574 family)
VQNVTAPGLRLPGEQYTQPMTREATDLFEKALTLSPEERAELVDSLLESLEGAHEDAAIVEAAWNDEIARRVASLDAGEAKTVSWEKVRRRISAKLIDGR